MKYSEQMDAHVESHKKELKKKERERIKALLKYLNEKKEYLSLSDNPVKKIHYSIEQIKPVKLTPFQLKKLSYSVPVELKKENVNISSAYDIPDISTTSCPLPVISDPMIPRFGFNKISLNRPDIGYTENSKAILRFDLASFKKPNIEVKLQEAVTKQNTPLPAFKFQKTGVDLPELKIPTISPAHIEFKHNVTQPDIKKEYDNVRLPGSLRIDSSKLPKDPGIKLPDLTVKPFKAEIDHKFKAVSVDPLSIPEPDLDLSPVLEKFRSALIKDLSKEEKHE